MHLRHAFVSRHLLKINCGADYYQHAEVKIEASHDNAFSWSISRVRVVFGESNQDAAFVRNLLGSVFVTTQLGEAGFVIHGSYVYIPDAGLSSLCDTVGDPPLRARAASI